MKYIFLIFLSSFFLFAHGQNRKENRFKNTVDSVIMYYTKKDSINFSHFIDTSIGLYFLYGTESGNYYAPPYKKLGFSQSFWNDNPAHVPIRLSVMNDSLKIYKLTYSELPEYELPDQKWNKEGLFVDTTKTNHLLFTTAKRMIRYGNTNISRYELNSIKKIENNSRRIVLANNHGDDFVFYLMYKNYKWYITIIDYATSD